MFTYENIDNNIDCIIKNIEKAAQKSGRDPKDITLVSVTKNRYIDQIRYIINKGLRTLGENRVQELDLKYKQLGDEPVKWHLIGHLQRNKVRDVIDKIELIHSVDSIRLLREINKEAIKIDKKMPILIQINVANEASKFGIRIEEIDEFINECYAYSNIIVKGLMTIAPYEENIEKTRPIFMKLKEIYDRIKKNEKNNVKFSHLSMGMTNDYTVAIEEGSTMIRIGTGIFEK